MTDDPIVYSTSTPHRPPVPPPDDDLPRVLCTTTTPEPHERGEFPMTCYACHMWADS